MHFNRKYSKHTFLEIINYRIGSYCRQEEVFLNDRSLQTFFLENYHSRSVTKWIKKIFRCALALLKFVFNDETVLGVSLEPCQFS